MSTNRMRKALAVVGTAGVVAALAVSPALGASGDSGSGVHVVNTETVQVYMSPDGSVDSKRVYEQLALTGKGTVDLANPVSTSGLRNLDGFGSLDVKNGNQIVKTTVDGETKLRSVSDFKGQLPLDVKVAYELNGKPIGPLSLVGKSGHLKVTFTVENVTGKQQQVTVPDGKGGTTTKTENVVVPIVGSVDTGTPATFTNVKSQAANMAGDGEGGTKLSFTMTLFPPIGSTLSTFGYEADVKNAIAPRVEISALPVDPLQSPTFASAATSYQGGADTGAKLADGASQIDANLLKLRDGAAELLAGLIQLRDGAGQLSTGLNNVAVPGSKKLAAGAGQLSTGLGQLDAGAGQLSAGSTKLAAGTGDAYAGSKQLQSGASQLSGGLNTLNSKMPTLASGSQQLADGQAALVAGLKQLRAGVAALPTTVQTQLASDPQYLALLDALQSIANGIGTRSDSPAAGTLLGGINGVQYGMRYPAGYGSTDCGLALTGGTPTKCGAMDGVQFIAEQLSTGASDLNQLKPVLAILNQVSNAGGNCPGYPNYAPPPNPPTNACQAVATLYYALFGTAPAPSGAQEKVNAAAGALQGIQQQVGIQLLASGAGLDQLRAGLNNPGANPNCLAGKSTPTPADDCGIKEAALFLKNAGIPALVNGITTNISNTLLAGIGASGGACLPAPNAQLLPCAELLAVGQGTLNDGVQQLVAGVTLLQQGGVQLSTGASQLAGGLGQIDTGASALSAGANKLAAGTGTAASGGQQVADGANQLSTGLGTAADGSTQLFDGLWKAALAAPQLPAGAQRLSTEGTKQLIAAGQSTAMSYGEMVSVMKAGAERAQKEGMAIGAPEGAVGLTAYSYIITEANGQGGRNLTRTLTGLGLLGALGGLMFYRRRALV